MLKRGIQHAAMLLAMLLLAIGLFSSPADAAIRGGFGHVGHIGFGGPPMAGGGHIGHPGFGWARGPGGEWPHGFHGHGGGPILIGGVWVDPFWDWDPYWYDAAYWDEAVYYPPPVYAAAQTCEYVTVKRYRHDRVIRERIYECW